VEIKFFAVDDNGVTSIVASLQQKSQICQAILLTKAFLSQQIYAII
jgi:hypothetical protein